ncbi:MAG: MFS transporter [Oscillospiraceae bacterium]|nr:MFS transporter [Oscillospiraceae bacterium]
MSKLKSNPGIGVLAAGSVLQLFLGIIYCWSAFVAPLNSYFEGKVKVNDIKLTSQFMLCCFVLGILASGQLQRKFKAKWLTLAGGGLMAVGMFIASFVSKNGGGSVWLIYIAYGVLGGLGVGLAYNTVITCAQKWFPKNRGLATGISVCTFGFATVIFAPLVKSLVGATGVISTLRILAGAFILVTLALFSFIKLPDEAANTAAANAALDKKQYTTSEILKTKNFYFITLSMMFFTATYFFLNPSFGTLAANRYGESGGDLGIIILQITGVASAIGRLLVPLLGDKIGRAGATLSIICATVLSAIVLGISGAPSFLFIAAIAVIAFCYGGSSGVYPVLTSEQFGIKHVGSNYGAVMVGFAVSALVFPSIIRLFGEDGSSAQFVVLTIMAFIAAVLIFLLMNDKKKEQKN